tara:strand:+ start:360 stop:1736 length:1377 start_codon:yes stop_codon:yes gene_type:complete
MKKMNLSKLISTRIRSSINRIALVGKNKNVSFCELVGTSSNIHLHGKRVILFITDTIELIKALVLLDGSAKAICPISTRISKKELHHVVSKNEFDYVISDLNEKDLEIFTEFNISAFKASEMALIKQKEIEPINRSTTWLIPTSGTTSLPKLVSHTLASLGVASLRRKRLDEKNEVWGQFYDITRYAGYQTLLNSLLNGYTLVTMSSEDPIHEKVERCADQSVTHISATPSQWRKIMMTGVSAKRIPLEQIVLGGEAADQKILDALSSFYPMAKITHTYASTEAGLGISVSDQLAGFPIRFLVSSEGFSEISIRDERLFIRTPSSANNYVDGKFMKDSQGWIDTGDLVKIEGDRFFIIGRQSGVINIGGDKVNPENVRQKLLEHSGVSQAVVFGKKTPITGMILAANIQLKSNVEEELAKLSVRTFIKENLQSKDQPRLVRFVDDIELTIAGKMDIKI